MLWVYGTFFVLCALAATALLYPLRRHRLRCLAIGAGFCVAALALYSLLGRPDILSALDVHHAKVQTAQETIGTQTARLQKDDRDLESWIRLGQAYAETSNWAQAREAFKRAVVLSGGQADLIMAYARSQIMAASGEVNDHAKESLNMVLMQKPDHAEARYYMAVYSLQEGKTEEAMQQMKGLYESLPDDSPVKTMINEQIGRD